MQFVVEQLDRLDHATLAVLREWQHPSWDLQEELQRQPAQLWVARTETGKRPVARALIWVVADEVHLLDVETHPDWRRRGAAHQLLTHLVGELKPARTVLEVRSRNRPALALYRSLGFEATRTRRGYYADGEDAIEMTLETAS